MREDPRSNEVDLLWIFIISLFVATVLHMLITWLALGILGETKNRITALEQHTGYAIDEDAP